MKEISLFVLIAGTKTHPSSKDLIAYLNGMADTYREHFTKLFNFSQIEFELITPPLLRAYFSITQNTNRNLHFYELYGFFGTFAPEVAIDQKRLKDVVTEKVFETLLQDTFLDGRIAIIPHYLSGKSLELHTIKGGYIDTIQGIENSYVLYVLNSLIRDSIDLEVDPKFKAQILLLSSKDRSHDS